MQVNVKLIELGSVGVAVRADRAASDDDEKKLAQEKGQIGDRVDHHVQVYDVARAYLAEHADAEAVCEDAHETDERQEENVEIVVELGAEIID